MIGDIGAALRFATILPVGGRGEFQARRIAVALPAAGLVIGVLLAVFDRIVGGMWPPGVVAALDVIFLAIITGALHLDGLADTADGLYGGQTREKSLEIMKDSRIGAMGVVALICCFLVKIFAVAELTGERFWMLVLIPAYARAGTLFGFSFLSYGRRKEGTALAFFETPLTVRDFFWPGILVVFSVVSGRWLLLNLCFAVITTFILWFYQRKLGCITGDMLGAMVEVTEAGLLLAAAAA